MKIDTFFQENIRLSFASIQGNRLRSILTMAIIAIGIMSLVGIVTAIESIKVSLTESFTSLGAVLPYPDYMQQTQEAYVTIYTYVPRIVAASLVSFLLGELANAKALVLIRRVQRGGKALWVRTIGSSMVGYLFDTVLFVVLAFAFTVPASELLSMIAVQYAAKLLIEAAAGTPLAYWAVSLIRRKSSV